MGQPQARTEHYTYADYLGWPEDTRYELIDGVAYAMAPAPTRSHQLVTGELFRQIASTLKGSPCHTFVAPFDVRLPRAGEADAAVDTVVQPDVLVVCDPAKVDERGVRGAPDWVGEVLSPASAGRDQTVKLAAYERAGVPEVWLLHPTDRVLTIYRLEGNRYGRPTVLEMKGRVAIGVLPEVVVDFALFTE
ncbi:MAG: Uma2 family endonuclease [Thiobacillaceae bacterium]